MLQADMYTVHCKSGTISETVQDTVVLKMTNLKLHDMKMTDQIKGCETDGAKVKLTSCRFTPSTSLAEYATSFFNALLPHIYSHICVGPKTATTSGRLIIRTVLVKGHPSGGNSIASL